LPAGSTVTTTVTDDTQPGGPQTRTRTYTAPFALASREADYRIAWDFLRGIHSDAFALNDESRRNKSRHTKH
jgi:hypothetical protein